MKKITTSIKACQSEYVEPKVWWGRIYQKIDEIWLKTHDLRKRGNFFYEDTQPNKTAQEKKEKKRQWKAMYNDLPRRWKEIDDGKEEVDRLMVNLYASIEREGNQQLEKKKNTKESVYIFSVPIDEIKKRIMNRSMVKIEQVITMTNKIREDIYEFDQHIGIAPSPETDVEQEKKAKKIDDFQEEIRKRWEDVWRIKEEIHTITDIIYEMSQIRRKYIGVAEEEQMSWADIRQEIKHKMKNSFCF